VFLLDSLIRTMGGHPKYYERSHGRRSVSSPRATHWHGATTSSPDIFYRSGTMALIRRQKIAAGRVATVISQNGGQEVGIAGLRSGEIDERSY